jgi:adenosylcobinamide-GDP ribazoletransferase
VNFLNQFLLCSKQQLNLMLLALGFFSRIPLPAWVSYSSAKLNRASRYFGLVGWLLGALVAAVFILADYLFSSSISLWLAMLFSLLLTGAFHEDGLADTADGCGGGYQRAQKLLIMKDSRLGTYGAAALLMALLGKYLLLIEAQQLALNLLLAYALSRCLAASLIFDMDYVSDPDASKSKPLANNQARRDLIILLASSLPALLLLSWPSCLLLATGLTLVRYTAKAFFTRQLGGYTGDCLGAAQQVSELSIYALLLLAQTHPDIFQ